MADPIPATPGAAPPPGEALLSIRDLSHWYGEGRQARQILFDLEMDLHRGEVVVLVGPSGSGKTTLLTLIGALRSVQQGDIRLLGHSLRGASEGSRVRARRRIGFVFQQHNLLRSLTAQQNVELALELHGGTAHQRRERARAALEQVGLAHRVSAFPGDLSGGEKQRVAIARALAGRPDLVLADEPTASLDGRAGRAVVELLEGLARDQGAGVLMVTHDRRVTDLADRLVQIEDGRLRPRLPGED